MAFTINGIACEEIVAGYREGADLGSGVSSRKGFLCDWNDRFTLALGLLGRTQAAGKGTTASPGATITFYYPASHPELVNCFVHSVEFEGVGAPSQGGKQLAWTKCIVWANFATQRFTPSAQNSIGKKDHGFVYAEQKISCSAEYVTIPKRATYFKISEKKTTQDFTLRLCLMEIEITLHALPYMPDFIVQQKAGTINNAEYLGIATGQLLFNGVTTQEAANTNGEYTLEGTYSFTARTQRWDYAYDPQSDIWDQVVKADFTTPFFTSTDFSTIIPTGYTF